MKRSKKLALTLAGLLLLTGCGQQVPETVPETTQQPTMVREITEEADNQADIQLCKDTLLELQTHDHIWIQSTQRNRGPDVLNDTTTIDYIQSGEDEYNRSWIPMDGFLDGVAVWGDSFETLKVDGVYYNNFRDGYTLVENDTYQSHFGLSTSTPEQDANFYRKPWLLRFQWEDSKLSHISTVDNGVTRAIRLQVEEPFYLEAKGENYTVEFFFTEGKFERVELVARFGTTWETGAGETGVSWLDVTVTEEAADTDPTSIEKTMEAYYETALEDIKNKPEDQ